MGALLAAAPPFALFVSPETAFPPGPTLDGVLNELKELYGSLISTTLGKATGRAEVNKAPEMMVRTVKKVVRMLTS